MWLSKSEYSAMTGEMEGKKEGKAWCTVHQL